MHFTLGKWFQKNNTQTWLVAVTVTGTAGKSDKTHLRNVNILIINIQLILSLSL